VKRTTQILKMRFAVPRSDSESAEEEEEEDEEEKEKEQQQQPPPRKQSPTNHKKRSHRHPLSKSTTNDLFLGTYDTPTRSSNPLLSRSLNHSLSGSTRKAHPSKTARLALYSILMA
jgi:FtsZ-interacting cell division protein YlmF